MRGKTKIMTVEMFTFCEYANEKRGSLNIQGTFDSWRGKEFPMKLPQFCVVLRVRLPPSNPFAECQLVFLDPDGDLALQPSELSVKGPVANFVFMNRNVKLAKSGTYRAVVMADDKLIASLPLFVSKVAEPKLSASPCLN